MPDMVVARTSRIATQCARIERTIRAEPWRYATWLHWISLAFAACVLAWVNRHQWFNSDEWAFLVGRRLGGGAGVKGLFEPHNEHWSTIPVLIYRALFSVFGVRTYAPYLAVMIGFHLLLAHLLWRLLRRMKADPFLATGAVALFAVLGVGWENLTSAFQFQFFGALPCGIGALLVLGLRPDPPRKRQFVAAGLLILGLMFSGLGVIVVIVVGACTLVRSGARIAATVAAPAIAVYAVWYLAEGRVQAAGQQPLRTAIQVAPEFVWRGLVDASDHALGLDGVGPVVLVLLAIFVFTRLRADAAVWPDVALLAAGAVLFLGLTALRRSGLGASVAGSPRYSYVVVLLLLPAAVFALDKGLGRGTLRIGAALVLALALLIVQLSALNSNAKVYAALEQEQKRRIVATAALLRGGSRTLEDLPVPNFLPDLTNSRIRQLDRGDDLPENVHPTERDLLTAAAWVQLDVSSHPGRPGAAPSLLASHDVRVADGAVGCVIVRSTGDSPSVLFRFPAPGQLRLRPARATSIVAELERGALQGGSRTFNLPGDETSWLRLATGGDLRVSQQPDRAMKICGLTPAG